MDKDPCLHCYWDLQKRLYCLEFRRRGQRLLTDVSRLWLMPSLFTMVLERCVTFHYRHCRREHPLQLSAVPLFSNKEFPPGYLMLGYLGSCQYRLYLCAGKRPPV
jgi:hypothetical protein